MTRQLNFIFLSSMLILASCGSIEPVSPEVRVDKTVDVPEAKVSIITLPIAMDLKPIFDKVNNEVPDYYKDAEQTCEGVSYAYEFKRAPILFNGEDESVRFTINGQYALKLNYCALCTNLFSSKGSCVVPRIYASCGVDETRRKIEIEYLTQLGIESDYSLKAKTKLAGVKAISPCKITVFNYNATQMVEEEFTSALKDVEEEIDEQITLLDIKPDIEEVWNSLSEDIDLGIYGKLNLNPEAVAVTPIKFEKDSAFFTAQIKARPAVRSLSDSQFNKKPLPNLAPFKKDDEFNIDLDIDYLYDSLNVLLQESLGGYETTLKKRKVFLDSIQVYGASDSRLSFRVKFSGSKQGTLYLTGTPAFEADSQFIAFPDLDFSIETKDALLKSAKWLFDGKITKTIRDYAQMDLRPTLNELKEELNKELNMEVEKGVFLDAKLDELAIRLIQPLEQRLLIRIYLNGKGSVRL